MTFGRAWGEREMLVAGAAEQVSWRLDYIQTQLTTTPSTSPTNANQTNRTETSRNAILPTPSKSVTRNMDQVKELSEVPQKFLKEGSQFMNRCTKPDQKEFIQICRAVAIGFAIMGFIGYFVKLIHIPINGILVGGA
ncbi:hypothetical protein Pst134EB_008039 [Puccinia striiformis f. sp. tritici]|nr:hypothetical protein Pst134EB_008039 [Puccinia striiformis f. sp. tritici]